MKNNNNYLQKAREYYARFEGTTTGNVLEDIFPELKESEDKRIRKALIDYFDDVNKANKNPLLSYGIHTDKVIVWLKKQGEQKPANKVEPNKTIITEEEKDILDILIKIFAVCPQDYYKITPTNNIKSTVIYAHEIIKYLKSIKTKLML